MMTFIYNSSNFIEMVERSIDMYKFVCFSMNDSSLENQFQSMNLKIDSNFETHRLIIFLRKFSFPFS